jgi:hypothetical protein
MQTSRMCVDPVRLQHQRMLHVDDLSEQRPARIRPNQQQCGRASSRDLMTAATASLFRVTGA